MMKRLLAALLFMLPSTAWATCSSVPYTFTPNTLIQSSQVNANFAAVVNCANTIDASQITTGVLPVARGGTNNPTWTAGSVVFATASTQLGQDNANLFWDSTNHRFGVGTNTPSVPLEVNGEIVFASISNDVRGFLYDSGGEIQFEGHNAANSSKKNIDIDAFGGNVGIGMTSPTARLEVNGTTYIDGTDNTDSFRVYDTAKTHWFDIKPETASGGAQIGYWIGSGWGATSVQGNVGVNISGLPAFTVDVNGTVNATQYDLSSNIFAVHISTYNYIYDGAGNAALGLSSAGDPTNYYRNTNHVFQNIGGGTQYATIGSGGVASSGSFNCGGAANSQCVHSTFSGDSLNNYTNSVWGFYASGGTPAQLFSGQYSTQAPGTAGSTTACLVGGYYLAGMSGLTVCGSDARLKDIGDPLSDGLSLVDQLKPVNYVWKDGVEKHPRADDALHGGFIAQDVLKIMPQCVNKNPDDFYSLDSNCLIAYLAKAIQELDAKVSSK